MLLVIHNLPLNTRFGDVKALLLEKCGLRNLILDKLIFEDNAMKITVGLPTEEDAALLVRKINGLYLKGHQLYVQDLRQKPSEQPYRLPKPRQDDNQHQNWNNNQQQGWNSTQQQGWNSNQQQGWNISAEQSWNDTPQQTWNNNQQQSWDNSSKQNWKPSMHRSNEFQQRFNPFLSEKQNQNVQGGYRQDLKTAAAMWAQQAQQVNTVYDNPPVHYSQNIQYPQQFGQLDNQGHGGWGQDDQNQGFEQGRGDYANSNTSWGESSVPAQSRGRSQEARNFNDSRRGQPDRSFEQDSRDFTVSRQYSQPREERFERSPNRNKRRWEESERCDDNWRQRPASPPREFRHHHRGRDNGVQRSGVDTKPEPWTVAPNQRFLPPNPRFKIPKPRFETSKPKFETNLKFNKKQKFNAPNQKFNTPKFNQLNPNTNKLETLPWNELTEKQQQKVIKRNEFNRSNTVKRITLDIFNDLGLCQEDIGLKTYFTDPVRSRLNKVLGDEKFIRLDMMYAKYLDAYNNEKEKILEEAKQLQRDGVEPKLQKLFIKPAFNKRPLSTYTGNTTNESQPKRFKADGAGPAPRSGPPKPVSGKIPSYIDGDKQRFKAIKQQHLKDMKTLRCPDVGPQLEKIVDEEVDAIANIFHKVIEKTPDKKQKTFLQERANGECLDDFKKMFKQKISQRLTNEGAKIVRIYAYTGKPPKKAELEPFMRQFGVLALKKSDRKPFFTAHLDSYETLDKLCNMGNVKIGQSDVIFKPLHMTPKYKRIHISRLNKLRGQYVASQIKKPEVNILEKDWEIKLAAIKEKEEILKQEKAAQDLAKRQEVVQNAAKKETNVKAEIGDVQAEIDDDKAENGVDKAEIVVDKAVTADVKGENVDDKVENGNIKSENDIIRENYNIKPENDNVELGNGNAEQENSENPNTDVHTDKYGELHSNFDVIDEVQGSDTENEQNNDNLTTDEGKNERSDESILRDMPIATSIDIIFEEDESGGDDVEPVLNEDDIDLDNIDEDDLVDY